MKRKSSQKKNDPFMLIGWIALCEAAGIIGSLFTVSAIPTWYASLVKPVFSPPNWLFGPVWTALYALMGIAAYRIFRLGVHKKTVQKALVLFGVHLFFNAVWSVIFFGGHNILLAFFDIAVLWFMIILVLFYFYTLDRVSAYILIPYLWWVSFAMILNYSIWFLNSGHL